MQTYIALLRGINVSGKNPIKMADLTEALSGKGLSNIRTYIQSGNLVFDTEEGNSEKFALLISDTISSRFGLAIPLQVFLRDELVRLRDMNPFVEEGIPTTQLHLTLLESVPAQGLADKIRNQDYSPDRYLISGKAVYLHCPAGYGRTKLTNTFFERKLGMVATTRNWATVMKLCSI